MYNLLIHCTGAKNKIKNKLKKHLVEVDVLVLLGNDGLEVAILDVGDGEGLEDSGVGVSEVAVLNLEARVNFISNHFIFSW